MPDSLQLAQQPVTVTQCDSYVVVSLWRSLNGDEDEYEYEPKATLNGALDALREYEDGEYPRARAVGIFAARNGLPIGGYMDPSQLMRLMRETRRA